MPIFRKLALAAATAGIAIALPASAQTHVISSSPAAAAMASNVKTVTVTFNEAITPAQSGLEIVMTSMPGMAGHHPAMKISGVNAAPSADRKALVAKLVRPLPAGTYDVNWWAAGADGHRVSGKVSFTVR